MRGLREIPLDAGSHAVLLQTEVGRATRRAADGRRPVANAADLRVAGVRQIRAIDRLDGATNAPSSAPATRGDMATGPALPEVELTVLTSWADAVAEALWTSPDRAASVMEEARAGAPWRDRFGVAPPSPELSAALEDVAKLVTVASQHRTPTIDVLLGAIDKTPPADGRARLVRAVLRSRLEWRASNP